MMRDIISKIATVIVVLITTLICIAGIFIAPVFLCVAYIIALALYIYDIIKYH